MTEKLDSSLSTQNRFQIWLAIEERTKPQVYDQVFEAARISSLSYWLGIVFAAAIATFGLVLNSPAVIIGAMLISPLMGPIMATGLALTLGDLYLSIKALTNLVVSVGLAVALSAFMVWLLPFHSTTAEILSRTNPNLLDLGVAVFSGLAGSVIVCRGSDTGGVTALPGVAIAVALMPPLCAMGFGFGSGGNLAIVGGAGLLFLANIVAIVSSAFVVFLLVGMNSQCVRDKMRKSQEEDPLAKRLTRGPLGRPFNGRGHLIWRILILLALLTSIAVPLRRALMQVASETVTHSVVEAALKKLAPSGSVVSRSVIFGLNTISAKVISTNAIPPLAVKHAEKEIADRTGKKATITVEQVESKSEVAEMLARMDTPPATQAVQQKPKELDDIRKDLLARIAPAVSDIWPPEASLQSLDVDLNKSGIVLNVKYQATKELDPVAQGLILHSVREKLQTQNVALNASRESPQILHRERR